MKMPLAFQPSSLVSRRVRVGSKEACRLREDKTKQNREYTKETEREIDKRRAREEEEKIPKEREREGETRKIFQA